jgi:hypothetical protein
MIMTGKSEELGENPVPVTLSPTQTPHRPTWVQTRASAGTGRRLTEPITVVNKCGSCRASKPAMP